MLHSVLPLGIAVDSSVSRTLICRRPDNHIRLLLISCIEILEAYNFARAGEGRQLMLIAKGTESPDAKHLGTGINNWS